MTDDERKHRQVKFFAIETVWESITWSGLCAERCFCCLALPVTACMVTAPNLKHRALFALQAFVASIVCHWCVQGDRREEAHKETKSDLPSRDTPGPLYSCPWCIPVYCACVASIVISVDVMFPVNKAFSRIP
jgi:hypothetical protein